MASLSSWQPSKPIFLSFSAALRIRASGGGAKCVIKKIVKRAVRRKSVYNSDCKVLVLLLNQMNVFLNSTLHWEGPRFESRWGTFFTGCLSDFFILHQTALFSDEARFIVFVFYQSILLDFSCFLVEKSSNWFSFHSMYLAYITKSKQTKTGNTKLSSRTLSPVSWIIQW